MTNARVELVESLLLRIPLPVLYAAEGEKDNWDIVDGIQRLFFDFSFHGSSDSR